MNQILLLIGAASLVGAVLFFTAGFLAARKRVLSIGPIQEELENQRIQAEQAAKSLHSKEEEASSALEELLHVKKQLNETERQLLQTSADLQINQTMLEQRNTEVDQLRGLLGNAERPPSTLTAIQQEFAARQDEVLTTIKSPSPIKKLEDDLDEAKLQIATLLEEQKTLMHAIDTERTKNAEMMDTIGMLGQEKSSLKEQLRKIQESYQRVQGLQNKNTSALQEHKELQKQLKNLQQNESESQYDLMVERMQNASQRQEIEELKREQVVLKKAAAELKSLQDKLRQLKKNRQQQKAQAQAQEKQAFSPGPPTLMNKVAHVPPKAASPKAKILKPSDDLRNSLEDLVKQLERLDFVRSAAITDKQGFVVAGGNTLSEELSAFGALFMETGLRAQDLLPLDAIQHVFVQDEQSTAVNVLPLNKLYPSFDLLLVALGGGGIQNVKKLEDFMFASPNQISKPPASKTPKTR